MRSMDSIAFVFPRVHVETLVSVCNLCLLAPSARYSSCNNILCKLIVISDKCGLRTNSENRPSADNRLNWNKTRRYVSLINGVSKQR
jgi:hypothetical protein